MDRFLLGFRQRAGILLLLLGYLVAPNQAAIVIETCSAAGNTTCEAEFKNCFYLNATEANVTSEERCGRCIEGYIRSFTSLTVCQPIANISYQEYLDVFSPMFSNEANVSRLAILIEVATFVSTFNAQFPPPDFELQINDVSAFSTAEILKRNGFRSNGTEPTLPLAGFLSGSNRDLQTIPDAVDWVTAGAVTDVKNQGQCGCCWTISTVGAVEGLAAIDSNFAFLESLSFQQLISCDTTSYGCDGGYVTTAMQYVQTNSIGGVVDNQDYPFTDSAGTTSTSCLAQAPSVAVETNSTFSVTTYSTPGSFSARLQNMKAAVAKQPVSILINANCNVFQTYHSGVITNDGSCSCSSPNCLDHAVLMVGYNDTADIPYLLVKNSWGTGWGESGYFRVSQQQEGQYGLFGILAQGTIPGGAENVTGATGTSGASTNFAFSAIQCAGTVALGLLVGFAV